MYGHYGHPEQIRDVFKSVGEEDIENIRFYIADGADPDMRDGNGHTLLLHALIQQKYHAAETLLEMGADPNLTVAQTGHAALHYAAADGHAHMIGVLRARGAEMELKDNHGWTPLHMAVGKGKMDGVQALVEAGADIAARGAQNERAIDLALHDAAHPLEMIHKPAQAIALYLREQMDARGVEFMTKAEREEELSRDLAALKSRNPNRFKLSP